MGQTPIYNKKIKKEVKAFTKLEIYTLFMMQLITTVSVEQSLKWCKEDMGVYKQ